VNALSTGSVGLISNPASGHNRDQFERIRTRIDACPAIRHVVTRQSADIPGALVQLRDAGVELLAINGGDGTVSAILGRMLEAGYFDRPPPVVVLPGGTANMNAGDVGVRGSLRRAVERFCRWCEAPDDSEQRVRRSLLRVELNHHSAPCFGMFLGAGAIIQGTEYAHREIHARGLRDDISLALGTVRTVWGVARGHTEFSGHQRIGLSIDDGERRVYDTRILAISTLERLAFGMRPFWGTGPGSLRLTLMEHDCTRFARTFLGIARGKPGANAVPEQGYFSHNGTRVTLDMEGSLNLDGEIIEASGSVRITATEQLEFIRL
jgi:diacylglycerol kinase family enzyme